jgi:transposase
LTGFITRIGHLFALEARAQDAGIAPAARQRLREEYSRALLAEIEDLLLRHLHTVLPQSLFRKALPQARTADDYEALLPVGLTPTVD